MTKRKFDFSFRIRKMRSLLAKPKKQEWLAFGLSVLIGAVLGSGLSYHFLVKHHWGAHKPRISSTELALEPEV